MSNTETLVLNDCMPTIQQADMAEHIRLMRLGIRGAGRTFHAIPSLDKPGTWLFAMDSEEGLRLFLGLFRGGVRHFKTLDALIALATELGITEITTHTAAEHDDD